jgi:hypothetical protein
MSLVERLLFLLLAMLFVIGAVGNKVFHWGKMGGGSSGRRMPTWLARTILLTVAGMFVWFSFQGQW